MNPFTYKAHPILIEWIGLLNQSSTNPSRDLSHCLALLAFLTPFFAITLIKAAKSIDDLRIPFVKACGLGVPAALLYTPLTLTLLNDVIHHAFIFSERWFLLFALLATSQILVAFYAFLIHSPRERGPVGLETGLGISLSLLLASILTSLALLGIDALIHIF